MQDAKPFTEYADLVALLENRGMDVGSTPDEKARAERKISQIGYYRLSGFSYPCREIARDSDGKVIRSHGKPKRLNTFVAGTRFSDVLDLYLFDKKLRLLMLDALERIEIHLKTVIVHETGKQNVLAYSDPSLLTPKYVNSFKDKRGRIRNKWDEWSQRQASELERCKEDSLVSHRKAKKEIPIWVAVEAWSFGTLSQYYEMLKAKHRAKIAKRLGVSNSHELSRWLQELNILRNRCAHHTRIWNQEANNPLNLPSSGAEESYYSAFGMGPDSRKRIFVLITICWYLVHQIGPNSDWVHHVIDLLDNFPNLPLNRNDAMGIPADSLNSDGTINIDLFL